MPEINFIIFQSLNMAIAAGISIFVLFYMTGKLLFTWPKLDARLEQVRADYSLANPHYLKENLNYTFMQTKKKKDKKKGDFKKRIIDTILKNPFLDEENMKTSFEQAGWHAKETQIIFLTSKLLSFFLGIAVGYIVIRTRPSLMDASGAIKWLILILTSLSGWLVPDLFLKGVIKKRVELIEKQFPDALDLIIICLQAGLGLNRAIERVAKEISLFGKEIGYELMITNVELEIILDRRQALQNLYSRVPSQIIRTFTTTVLQSIQQGTPTLHALDILSKEIRDTRMHKAETKAAKLPSLMVIPLVLFVMPNLFIVLLGPAIVRLLNVQ
ncbi:MAG: type II secretion system F family protein [Alphaproteobacteria bacterium]|jgi:tight adherence protein C|nr:type II secretion system F family protein [Alphaproteobacteria bacterium]